MYICIYRFISWQAPQLLYLRVVAPWVNSVRTNYASLKVKAGSALVRYIFFVTRHRSKLQRREGFKPSFQETTSQLIWKKALECHRYLQTSCSAQKGISWWICCIFDGTMFVNGDWSSSSRLRKRRTGQNMRLRKPRLRISAWAFNIYEIPIGGSGECRLP